MITKQSDKTDNGTTLLNGEVIDVFNLSDLFFKMGLDRNVESESEEDN